VGGDALNAIRFAEVVIVLIARRRHSRSRDIPDRRSGRGAAKGAQTQVSQRAGKTNWDMVEGTESGGILGRDACMRAEVVGYCTQLKRGGRSCCLNAFGALTADGSRPADGGSGLESYAKLEIAAPFGHGAHRFPRPRWVVRRIRRRRQKAGALRLDYNHQQKARPPALS